jgi:hypothetical protein
MDGDDIMLKSIPIKWWRLGTLEFPVYYKGAGIPFLVINEEGSNIFLVETPDRVTIPRFELSAESKEDLLIKIIDNIKILFSCGLEQMDGTGTIYGVLDSSITIHGEGDILIHEVYLGLGYTIHEFNPRDRYLDKDECEKFGIPYEVILDDVESPSQSK